AITDPSFINNNIQIGLILLFLIVGLLLIVRAANAYSLKLINMVRANRSLWFLYISMISFVLPGIINNVITTIKAFNIKIGIEGNSWLILVPFYSLGGILLFVGI